MQIISIKGTNNVYSSNVYMVLGEWKKMNAVTTLIDVGSDRSIIEEDYVNALKRLCQKQVKAIYFGHGDPVFGNGQSLLVESLKNIRNGKRKEDQTFQQ